MNWREAQYGPDSVAAEKLRREGSHQINHFPAKIFVSVTSRRRSDLAGRSAIRNRVRCSEGNKLIGWGMATATYSGQSFSGIGARSFEPTGRVTVACGSQDLGTGTYTIMAQIAAATLDLPIESIDAKLGDSTLPKSPVSGDRKLRQALGPAVQAAARQAQLALLAAAAGDTGSPLLRAPMQTSIRKRRSSEGSRRGRTLQ